MNKIQITPEEKQLVALALATLALLTTLLSALALLLLARVLAGHLPALLPRVLAGHPALLTLALALTLLCHPSTSMHCMATAPARPRAPEPRLPG